MKRGAKNERGFTLAALIVFLTAAAVMLAVGVPAYQIERQREMEEELIFRAQEYVRAILKYQRQNGIYPPDLDALFDTNGIRYLRREYTDPFTGAPFRLLTVNGDGTIEGSTIYDDLMDGGGLFQGMDGQAFGESSSNMPSAGIGTTAVLAFPSMQSVPGAGGGGGEGERGGDGNGGGNGGGGFDAALDTSFSQGDFGGFGGGPGAGFGGGGGFGGNPAEPGAGFGGGTAGQNANFGGAITGGAGFGSNVGEAFGGNANFGQSITPGGGGFGGGGNNGGFGPASGGFGQTSGFGAGNGTGGFAPSGGTDTSGGFSFRGGASGVGGSFVFNQQGTANPRGQESGGGGNDGFQPNFGAGGIVGVAPDLEGPSLKVYNERERYEEWEFIAIPGYGTVPAPVQQVEDDGLGDGQMQMFPGN